MLFLKYYIHLLIGKGRLRCELCDIEGSTGTIRSRKMLTLKELQFGNWMYDIYLPVLEKYV